jgi:integrase
LPKRALTDASVKRLKPPVAGQIDVFDQGYPGLALRVSYGGGKSWVYFYRLGGKLRRMTIGPYPALALKDARTSWRDAREEVQKGRDPAVARNRERPATNFEKVSEEWLRRDQAGNRSCDEVKRILDRDVIPVWGHRAVAELGRRDVLDLIDGIADRGAVTMARRVQAHLHRFFKWAVGRGILESNPAADLPKPGSEVRRDRVLSGDEIASVWRGCEQLAWPFGTAICSLLLTGARREEIGQLRWSELDGDSASINLRGARTKNAQPHTIPLSTVMSSLLNDVPRIGVSDYVFTTNGKTPVSGWSRAKDRLDQMAMIDPWRLHDLRRTVATGMQKLGVGLQVIEAVLGHVSGSRAGVVGVYQRHSFDAEKRLALEAWGAHVIDLIEGREPGKVLPLRGTQ